MILGNTATQDVFRTYMLGTAAQKTNIPFVLLVGPRHVGKTSLVLHTVHDVLGPYLQQDFLYIQDFGEQIGKRHNLKLRTINTNIVSKQLLDDFSYQDIGVEDVVSWLQKSPIGQKKIVFLENIDRLVDGADSILLKTLEEPLVGRIIIASVSHISAVLPTLVSRALALYFNALNTIDMTTYIQTTYSTISYPDTMIVLAQGRPGLLPLLLNLLDQIPEAFAVVDSVVRLGTVTNKYSLYKSLTQFQKAGIVDIVLDGLIAYFALHKNRIFMEDLLYIKKYIDSNVSFENVALCLFTH